MMITFQPFLFLGAVLMGYEITDLVFRQMVTDDECAGFRDGLLEEERVVSLAASRFYESIRLSALELMATTGPGIVVCGERTIHFVRVADWQCRGFALELPALVKSCDGATDALVALERTSDAAIVRLGEIHKRSVITLHSLRGPCNRAEVLGCGLQYLLEHY